MRNMVAAERRSTEPLLKQAEEVLDLDEEKLVEMDCFLAQAWAAGALAGHANMTSKVFEGPLELGRFEDRVKPLIEQSADTLNLTMSRTVMMWELLSQAIVCGVKCSETELMASLIEQQHDIAAEALGWLEERGRGGRGQPPA